MDRKFRKGKQRTLLLECKMILLLKTVTVDRSVKLRTDTKLYTYINPANNVTATQQPLCRQCRCSGREVRVGMKKIRIVQSAQSRNY